MKLKTLFVDVLIATFLLNPMSFHMALADEKEGGKDISSAVSQGQEQLPLFDEEPKVDPKNEPTAEPPTEPAKPTTKSRASLENLTLFQVDRAGSPIQITILFNKGNFVSADIKGAGNIPLDKYIEAIAVKLKANPVLAKALNRKNVSAKVKQQASELIKDEVDGIYSDVLDQLAKSEEFKDVIENDLGKVAGDTKNASVKFAKLKLYVQKRALSGVKLTYWVANFILTAGIIAEFATFAAGAILGGNTLMELASPLVFKTLFPSSLFFGLKKGLRGLLLGSLGSALEASIANLEDQILNPENRRPVEISSKSLSRTKEKTEEVSSSILDQLPPKVKSCVVIMKDLAIEFIK